jgi:hypothetical protein
MPETRQRLAALLFAVWDMGQVMSAIEALVSDLGRPMMFSGGHQKIHTPSTSISEDCSTPDPAVLLAAQTALALVRKGSPTCRALVVPSGVR